MIFDDAQERRENESRQRARAAEDLRKRINAEMPEVSRLASELRNAFGQGVTLRGAIEGRLLVGAIRPSQLRAHLAAGGGPLINLQGRPVAAPPDGAEELPGHVLIDPREVVDYSLKKKGGKTAKGDF